MGWFCSDNYCKKKNDCIIIKKKRNTKIYSSDTNESIFKREREREKLGHVNVKILYFKLESWNFRISILTDYF